MGVDETYYAACKAEYLLFNRSKSQLTYFTIIQIKSLTGSYIKNTREQLIIQLVKFRKNGIYSRRDICCSLQR